MMKNLLTVKEAHKLEFAKFLTFLLPEYEKNCLSEYCEKITEGRYVFADSND